MMNIIKHTAFVLISLLICHSVTAEHQVTAELEQASITFKVPDAITEGTTHPLVVSIQPTANQPAPDKIRARIGMPGHGHWISQEGFHAFAAEDITFVGERCTDGKDAVVSDQPGIMCIDPWFDTLYPMSGRYRIRVWLNYADGNEATAAIDLNVVDGESLDPQLVVQ